MAKRRSGALGLPTRPISAPIARGMRSVGRLVLVREGLWAGVVAVAFRSARVARLLSATFGSRVSARLCSVPLLGSGRLVPAHTFTSRRVASGRLRIAATRSLLACGCAAADVRLYGCTILLRMGFARAMLLRAWIACPLWMHLAQRREWRGTAPFSCSPAPATPGFSALDARSPATPICNHSRQEGAD